MPRLAVITNVLAHYRAPCFQRLAEFLQGQVAFFVLTKKMEHRHYVMADGQGGLPAVKLRGWQWSRFPHDDVHLNDIRPVLRDHSDIVILGGWDEPTYLLLWTWAVVARKKLLFWIESTAYDASPSLVKQTCKRLLLSQAAGCIVPGHRAYNYCRQLGMPEDHIFVAPNATDRAFFVDQAKHLLPNREMLRTEANLRGLTILFVGRLVEKLKGISTLIRACAHLEKRKVPMSLLLAGDGPDRRKYEELVRRHVLGDVRFLGTLSHEALSSLYAVADVLVLPSRCEPWGFVLNEGMEFGLPLVVSEAVGAGPDLVRPGENGFVVPVGDELILAQILERLARDEGMGRGMGEVSQSIIKRFSPERWAEGVIQAISSVI
jgi:glycosyltransferase involved in cell wall biosynthesis